MQRITHRIARSARPLARLGAALLIAGAASAQSPAPGPGAAPAATPSQTTFASAKEGADAFVAALGAGERSALDTIFGPRIASFAPADPVTARVENQKLAEAAKEALLLREDGPDQVTLVIGAAAWPFPIPLVQENGRWRFDTDAGYEELLDRIVGAHELAAIELLRAYVDAQAEYATADRDGDQVLEYAQHILSPSGTKEGLYWPTGADGEESPFGPFVAEAGPYAKGRKLGDPYRGYYFRVLKKQGRSVPGGAYDYVINGNMIGGFALLAFPADYGNSGVMTFAVNQQGKVFQKDLGEATPTLVDAIATYDVDSTWAEVAE